MTVLDEIAARRQRQVEKGYDAAHDDDHTDGSLLAAAESCINVNRKSPWTNYSPPWGRDALIDAAAFIVAEIERWDRMPDEEAEHARYEEEQRALAATNGCDFT